ncbi:ACDE family multidrug resistance protein [Heliophilum fasciatum]|uniref:ACDE family multidrug resistance protein n=1 Tax=Heliophilum fasciatum TaxID=35700 RepID=A0A4R2RL72_9FIRM|nr:ACDE family multidrug resistance protein [Heliophilum fasciatum]TCP63873.1 ACDE family multidrug resistance protein [Heliophilum fasciatum]
MPEAATAPTASSPKPSTGTLAALAGVPLIMVLGNSMLIPAFPQIREAMGITAMQTGLLITFFSIPAGLTIPFLGFLSDRVMRKKIVVPALLVYGVGGLISGLAPLLFNNSYTIMLIGRVIQGIAAAGTAPLAMALAGDLFKSSQRTKALGILEATNGLGKVLSPILGSLLVLWIWWALFFVYAALAIPVALAVAFLVKEPPVPEADKKQSIGTYFSGIFQLLKEKAGPLLTSFLGGMLLLFTLFGVLSYLSDALEATYNLTGVRKGLVLSIPVLASASVAFGSGFLFQKKPDWTKPLLLIGLGLFSGALLLSALLQSIPWVLGLLALLGVGVGLTLPVLNNVVTTSAPEAKRGAITSFYGGVRFLGVAFGPPVFNLLEKGGPWALYAPWSALGLVTLFLAWKFIQPPKPTSEQQSDPAPGPSSASSMPSAFFPEDRPLAPILASARNRAAKKARLSHPPSTAQRVSLQRKQSPAANRRSSQ